MANRYKLSPLTKSHVIAAADYFGPKHGIKDVGGWRSAGSVKASDHPKGLALDFMTRNKAVGDKLAADLIANYKQWNITYVIWWRRIWSPEKGWRSYSGPSAHTDHVHASFEASGKVPDTSDLTNVLPTANPLVPDAFEKGMAKLTAPETWRKFALNVGGFLLIVFGFLLLVYSNSSSVVAKNVGKVVKGATVK